MKRYLKVPYILSFIAVPWVFSSALVFVAADNLQVPSQAVQ
jgi:hypothetical protein